MIFSESLRRWDAMTDSHTDFCVIPSSRANLASHAIQIGQHHINYSYPDPIKDRQATHDVCLDLPSKRVYSAVRYPGDALYRSPKKIANSRFASFQSLSGCVHLTVASRNAR